MTSTNQQVTAHAAIHDALVRFEQGPHGDLALSADRAAVIAVGALVDAGILTGHSDAPGDLRQLEPPEVRRDLDAEQARRSAREAHFEPGWLQRRLDKTLADYESLPAWLRESLSQPTSKSRRDRLRLRSDGAQP